VLAVSKFNKDVDFRQDLQKSMDDTLFQTTDVMEVDEASKLGPEVKRKLIVEMLGVPVTKRGLVRKYTTKQILSGLNASPDPIIDLTKTEDDNPDYIQLLKALKKKHLHFAEDVRPPYRGTFTRTPNTSSLRKGRNPFQRALPGIDYDYDSEAEWVDNPEEGEGEELHSEDEDDTASQLSIGDMEDFLDDEEDETKVNKRNALLGPLVPISTGLIWADEQESMSKWEGFKMGILLGMLLFLMFS